MAGTKIVLPRSAREAILWDLHVILDGVPEGTPGREQFVRTVLRKLGVSWWKLRRLGNAVQAELPPGLENVDMTDVLAVVERVVGIEWKQDLVSVSQEKCDSFRDNVFRILSEAKRSMPHEVAPRIMDEVNRTFGPDVSPGVVPALHRTLEQLLIRELLVCGDDAASRQRLTDFVLDDVRRKGRLEIG